MKKIALVGRPNVGKSTLFNRLTGKRTAITDNQPGVTRDRREGKGIVGDLSFLVIDTPGMEDPLDTPLKVGMWQQSEKAVQEADIILFVVDGQEGVTLGDKAIARALRKFSKTLYVVVNKCEGRTFDNVRGEAYALGFGDPIPLSAEHGEGLIDLFEVLAPLCPSLVEEEEEEDEEETPLRLAIVGRPNAGKSTLINRLLKDERLLTGEQPGVTRDAIEIPWEYKGKPVLLVDTAGMRRRSKVTDRLEYLSVKDTLKAIQYAHVVVLAVDAEMPLDKQDLIIAQKVVEEGRCLVIAINKWDLIKEAADTLALIERKLEHSLAMVRGLPVVTMSAKTGFHLDLLMRQVFEVYELWQRRISTADLNRWLDGATTHHPPPIINQRRLRFKYVTQIKQRPPTFALFTNRVKMIPDSYLRYLTNSLRQTFKLPAVPIRFVLRAADNPYKERP